MTVTYANLWTDQLYDEQMIEATKRLWYQHLKDFEPKIIQEAALEATTRCEFPPKPKEMLEIVRSKNRLYLANKQMDENFKMRAIEDKRPKTYSKKTLEAKVAMWEKLGMHHKAQEYRDEISRMDLQKE